MERVHEGEACLEEEVLDLGRLAPQEVLEELEKLSSGESISSDLEDEIYALLHFGPSTAALEATQPLDMDTFSRRYFQDNICYECREVGHISRECTRRPPLVCSICGELGHRRAGCPQVICSNCGNIGHLARKCTGERDKSWVRLCEKCPGAQHLERECPAVYRTYAFEGLGRKEILRTCSVCFSKEHFLGECPSGHRSSETTCYRDPFPRPQRGNRGSMRRQGREKCQKKGGKDQKDSANRYGDAPSRCREYEGSRRD
jgi:Zinc knuckle